MIWLLFILGLVHDATWPLYPFDWNGMLTASKRYYSLPTLSWCMDGLNDMPGCVDRWDIDADGDVDLLDVAEVYSSPMAIIQER